MCCFLLWVAICYGVICTYCLLDMGVGSVCVCYVIPTLFVTLGFAV